MTTLDSKTLYQDEFFTIKSDTVKLDNEVVGTFEYIDSHNDDAGSVMVVPIDDKGYYYFVQMFQVGTGEQTITFPKGGSKEGFTAIQSAQEELQEEIGMKANDLVQIGTLYSHPGRAKRKHNIILAQGLQPSRLVGDEIETITILKLSLEEVQKMIIHGDINDAKTIASYYMAREYLSQ